MSPTIFLRIEGFIICTLSIFGYSLVSGDWLMFFLLLFMPDVTILGYTINSRIGAFIYNIGHSYSLPLILGVLSAVAENLNGSIIALIWLAHIGLDRMCGFGLKYPHGFKHTHLGIIGREK